MKRVILAITLVWALVMCFTVAQSMANEMIGKSKGMSEANKIFWDVKNSKGEDLGMITNFVKDPQGRIAFAIILHSDYPLSMYSIPREIAIPFGALTCGKQVCMLNASVKKLDSAPTLTSKKELAAEGKMAENIYRYFGLQPYWTEKGDTAPFMYMY